MNDIKAKIATLAKIGYEEQVKYLCRDAGRAIYASLTEADEPRRYRYVCESMAELNRLYKKEFGEYITPKYGITEEEVYEFALELIKNLL